MDEQERERWETHLRACANKAGMVFGIGMVSRARREALAGDHGATAFLATAAQVRDLLGRIARLSPGSNEDLAKGGATTVSVPNELILGARETALHWEQELPN